MYGEKIQSLHHLSDILREIQMYARERLENKWLPEFLKTSEFKKRHLVKRPMNSRRISTNLKVRFCTVHIPSYIICLDVVHELMCTSFVLYFMCIHG